MEIKKTFYDKNFYNSQSFLSLQAASIIVPFLLELFNPKSVVDIGCGLGTWLSVFKNNGVLKVLGMDGDYINESDLHIPKENFIGVDLCSPFKIDTTFDLAVCLEVAEHLPENKAESLIDLLTSLSSVVVFSAAIPGQGGRNHINEQWPDYWGRRFESKGYKSYDLIRSRYWNNTEIEPWYSQNMFIYINEEAQKKHSLAIKSFENSKLDFPAQAVHPELFNRFTSMEYIHSISMIKELIRRFKKKFL
jgi:SAM-dependent methyltransferase